MINNIKIHCIILIGIFSCQNIFAQIEIFKDTENLHAAPIITGVHTLSVHVRDTILQDSVYQFFLSKLKLPIYYTPVKYGQKKYAGIYSGNMVLEPCGPYQNIDYASDSFKAIFFGINFEVYESLAVSEQALLMRGIKHQVNIGSIYVRDSILCNENIFTALYEVRDKKVRDSLRNSLISNVENKPSIEYINEIFIGYKEKMNLLKWKDFLDPLEIGKNGICQINDSLKLHFSKGDVNEVKGITFKVNSLEKAKQYLIKNNLFGSVSNKKIKLNQRQSYGLSIYFTDED